MASSDVLVVDDDPDLTEVVLIALREAGYAARSAANGRQALAQVAERAPALVLLDMLMPGMDGWQFAKELRARVGRSVPVVVLTAAEHAGARGAEIDADDVLAKPFDLDELLATVARHTRERGDGSSREM